MGGACRDFGSLELPSPALNVGGAGAGGTAPASSSGSAGRAASGAGGSAQVASGDAGRGGEALEATAGEAGAPFSGAAQAGESGAAGAGGEPASPGVGGEEAPIRPTCKLYDWVTAEASVGLGIATTWFGSSITLYSWDPLSSAFIGRYSDSLTPTAWYAWYCLDVVPQVARISAMNLPNGRPEIFAATSRGELFVRREFPQTWGPWLPFSLPDVDSSVEDLAAVGGTVPRLYVADRGRVFVRAKIDDKPYSEYAPWRELRQNGAKVVAALLREDGAQQVISVAASGAVEIATQLPGSPDFGAWQPLPTLSEAIVDLVATETTGAQLTLQALGASGTLWSLAGESAVDWAAVDVALLGVKVVAIAGRSQGGFNQLYGVDATAVTYRFLAGLWVKTT